MKVSVSRPKVEEQQHHDDDQCRRNDDFELGFGALKILELPTPLDVITGRHLDLLRHLARRLRDVAAEVASLEIDVDVGDGLRVFRANAGRSRSDADAGDRA